MGTVGVPTSCSCDWLSQRLAVGDSRGNVALFDMKTDVTNNNKRIDDSCEKEQKPSSILNNVHRKEHVTDIMFSDDKRKILSVGNDGAIHESSIGAYG
eukprot:8131492-Ditylum_brightwellii.AAC.1